jgi:hypothetical protein
VTPGIDVHTAPEIEDDDPLLQWAPGQRVLSVVFFDPDHPMPVPTTNEILKSMGIAPIE